MFHFHEALCRLVFSWVNTVRLTNTDALPKTTAVIMQG